MSSTSQEETQSESESTSWSSHLSGFLKRAEHLPTDTFDPKRPLIELIVLRNSPVEHEGISLVLFTDHTVLDAAGTYSKLTKDDHTAFRKLVGDITTLPDSHNFRHQWRVKHERTGRPIDRFLVPRKSLEEVPKEDYSHEFYEIGIYGWDKHKTALTEPVDGYTNLAPALFEIGGLAAEAREGASGPRNDEALTKVRNILGNVF